MTSSAFDSERQVFHRNILRLRYQKAPLRPNAYGKHSQAHRIKDRKLTGRIRNQVSNKSLMVDLRHIFSLTDFLRHHREHISRLEHTHQPVVLTVKGKPSIVLQDAESYQVLLDTLADLQRRVGLPSRHQAGASSPVCCEENP
ncbi:hypothetical protein C0431_15295 [bacterium]|nr:hypothetical protein [bacterium]